MKRPASEKGRRGRYVFNEYGKKIFVPLERGKRCTHPTKGDYTAKETDGIMFTGEEIEFMLAMQAEKERLRRMLTERDILRVAEKLGYRKGQT